VPEPLLNEEDHMKLLRIYTGPDGGSHFEELDLPMSSVEFAPPAPPLDLSEFWGATRASILRAPPGWEGDWHPAPKRQLMFHLAGEIEGETSDGERRTIGPGTVVLLEDTTGKGHRSRVVGNEPAVIGVVQLED
jgi:hypothetical protein